MIPIKDKYHFYLLKWLNKKNDMIISKNNIRYSTLVLLILRSQI